MGAPDPSGEAPVRVFISYAQESPEHRSSVQQLAVLLTARGIQTVSDFSPGVPRRDWPRWMEKQIQAADFVLVVVSPAYRRRAEGDIGNGEGRGVRFEAALLRDLVYEDRSAWNGRLLPVVLPGMAVADIPRFLGPTSHTSYTITELTPTGIEPLVRGLTAQPTDDDPESNEADRPHPLGPIRHLHTLMVPTPFVGRVDQLAELDRWFATSPPGVPIVVHGTAGVGKSGLVTYWADVVHDRDGVDVLGFNLGGFGPAATRKSVDDAIKQWLKDLREPKLGSVTERRNRLVEILRDRRALLILDNVRSRGKYQGVRKLLRYLPATCRVVISSREPLDGLQAHEGADALVVPLFDARNESVVLLRELLGDRLAAEPHIAEQLAESCAGLPLALRVVAGTTAFRKMPLAAVVQSLSDASRALRELSRIPNDELMNVRVVFSWSYKALPSDDARRAFRLLGLHPAKSSTTDAHAMACMLDVDLDQAESLLHQLEGHSLLTVEYDAEIAEHLKALERPGRNLLANRIGRHDLLHSYARELLYEPENAAEARDALERISRLYYDYVNHAFDRLNTDNPMVDIGSRDLWRASDPDGVAAVDGGGSPLVWFDRERTNFVSVAGAAANAQVSIATALACSAFFFFEAQHHLKLWDAVEEAVEPHATSDGADRLDHARWLRNRGRRRLVDLIEFREQLRADADPSPLPTEPRTESHRLLTRSLERYEEVANEPDRQRSGAAGIVTVLRELADLRRLEIHPHRPIQGLVSDAAAAYEMAHAAFMGFAEKISQESQRNWTASFDLAHAMVYLSAARLGDAAALAEAGRLIGRCAERTDAEGKPRPNRLLAFAQRRKGDLHRVRNELDLAAAAYAESAATFEKQVHDALGCARSLAWQGRMMVGSQGHTIESRAVFVRAAHLLRANAAAAEADVVAGWMNARE